MSEELYTTHTNYTGQKYQSGGSRPAGGGNELVLKCLCGRCGKAFVLACDRSSSDVGEDGTRYSCVSFRSCESGGVYAATVECPWCGNRHELA